MSWALGSCRAGSVAEWVLDQLSAVPGTAAPLFGQSKPILEKPGDKGLISLDPALPEPTKPRLRLPLQRQLTNSSSLCTSACSPAGAGWVISSRGELARGTKKRRAPSPLFWVSRSC